MSFTPEDGEPWVSDEVDDLTQGIADRNAAAEEEAGGGDPSGTSGGITPYVFEFAYDDAGLDDGIPTYTPQVNDLLLNAFIVGADWEYPDGAPLADIGVATGQIFNYFGSSAIDLSSSYWDIGPGSGPGAMGIPYIQSPANSLADLSTLMTLVNGDGTPSGYGSVLRFTSTDPLLLWVTQTGDPGGPAVEATAGTGYLFLLVARPAPPA